MDKRLHHLDTTEEIDYYTKEVINRVNAKISEYNHNKKSNIANKLKISRVKHTNKKEVYPFILDNLSYEIIKEHLKIIDEKQSDIVEEEDLDIEDTGVLKIDTNGYANTLYIEALENKDNPNFKIDRAILQNENHVKKETNDKNHLLKLNRNTVKDNPFDKIVGDPEEVAKQLISNKRLDWPTISWHERVVMKKKKKSILRKYKKRINKNMIDTLPYLHMVVAFFSLILLLFLINASILLLEYEDFNAYLFYSSLTSSYILDIPSIIFILSTYIFLSLIYPITSNVYTWKYFSYYIDDAEKYLRNISRIRRLHLGTFTLYLVYTIMGSFIQLDTGDDNVYYRSMNGIPIGNLIPSIFIPVCIVYYLSIKQYYTIPRQKIDIMYRAFHFLVASSYLISLNTLIGFGTAMFSLLLKGAYHTLISKYEVYAVYLLNVYILVVTILILILLRFKLPLRSSYDWYNDLKNINLLQTLFSLIILIGLISVKFKFEIVEDIIISGNYQGISFFALIVNLIIVLIYLTIFYRYFGKAYKYITRDNEISDNIIISEIVYSVKAKANELYIKVKKLIDKYL